MLKNQFDLNDVEWKEFKISKIFDVRKSRAYHKLQLQFNNGNIPYITRTSMNNGLEGIVKNEDFILNPKDTISCGAENADFFYQGTEYISGNNVCYLKNNNINRYTGLFLVKMLQNSIKGCGFGFGKGLTGTRLKNRPIILPINSKGQPNWEFMENFMRKIEYKKLNIYLDYIKNKTATN